MTTPTSTPTSTATSTWPVQLRLPGQSAAHEGPVDMYMMYVMHHAFRRDLTAFAAAADATPSADRETWQALARRWEVFSTALHHHHSGEDAGLWPRLLEVADDEGRATLEAIVALAREHDLWIVSDEVSEGLVFGNVAFASPFDDVDLAQRTVAPTNTRPTGDPMPPASSVNMVPSNCCMAMM